MIQRNLRPIKSPDEDKSRIFVLVDEWNCLAGQQQIGGITGFEKNILYKHSDYSRSVRFLNDNPRLGAELRDCFDKGGLPVQMGDKLDCLGR